MAQQVKALAQKTDGLSLTPHIHIKVEEQTNSTKLFFDLHTWTMARMCIHAQNTHKIK